MIGALIVAHDTLAAKFIEVLERIVGNTEGILSVSIDWDDDHNVGINKVSESLKKLESYDGIIVFTDMFGGTPTNISLPFLEKGKVEIVTGVNLPMLIKFANMRNEDFKSFDVLIDSVKERAQQSIKVPGEIYFQKKSG